MHTHRCRCSMRTLGRSSSNLLEFHLARNVRLVVLSCPVIKCKYPDEDGEEQPYAKGETIKKTHYTSDFEFLTGLGNNRAKKEFAYRIKRSANNSNVKLLVVR